LCRKSICVGKVIFQTKNIFVWWNTF
jgi:hypothetical protein